MECLFLYCSLSLLTLAVVFYLFVYLFDFYSNLSQQMTLGGLQFKTYITIQIKTVKSIKTVKTLLIV